MTEWVSVLSHEDGDTVVTVSKEFAVNSDLEVLEDEVATANGQPLPPRPRGESAKQASTRTDWSKTNVEDLKAEIDRRNEDRDEDAQITVPEPGHKADLVSALQSDDVLHPEEQ